MVEAIKIEQNLCSHSRLKDMDFANVQFGKVYSDHMFVADYKNGQWQDFRIEPYDLLHFSPGAAILHYAQSVFEGLKAYKNDKDDVLIFRPEMNLKRLNISAERLCIPQIPEEIFMSGLIELLNIDKGWVPSTPGTALYIRPFIFATDEYIGIRPSENYKFIIFTCPVGAYYAHPVKVKIETHYTRAVEGGTGFAKAAGNYAASLYPARLAQKNGYDQLIWTDGKTHEYIEESGTMNVMFIIDDVLVTPLTGDSVLRGITRDSVLTLARDWGMKVDERRLSVVEVVEAIKAGKLQEAFGTGTAATIAHIDTISYKDIDYKLLEISSRKFSIKVNQALNAIKTGAQEDKHNWLVRL